MSLARYGCKVSCSNELITAPLPMLYRCLNGSDIIFWFLAPLLGMQGSSTRNAHVDGPPSQPSSPQWTTGCGSTPVLVRWLEWLDLKRKNFFWSECENVCVLKCNNRMELYKHYRTYNSFHFIAPQAHLLPALR